MKPLTRTIIELFDGKKRYLIPLYQRQYAWKVAPQLELLWDDIARIATKLERDGSLKAPHFMGAIVISQVLTFGRQVYAYEVIDGQQRLTTFQLLLIALRDVALSLSSEYASEITKYLFNEGVMDRPEVERFKLWPSLTDRRAFASVADIASDATTHKPEDENGVVLPAIAAHAYFKERIMHHVCPLGDLDKFKMEKLFEALRSGLAVVQIELEGGDDPQTIFETLNSRGVDLTAGDLMRNFIFQRAKGLGQEEGSLKIDLLYERYWLPLDRWFWRESETRGRLTRLRLDWLLADHLTMKRADLVSIESLFEIYRKWILDKIPFSSVEEELVSIEKSALVFRQITDQSTEGVFAEFGRFSKAFDVSTAMPLVLYLATEAEFGDDIVSALLAIKSYILRRDICGLPTGNYNRFFVDIIDKLRSGEKAGLHALRVSLSSSQAEATRWPSDSEWKIKWMGSDQYKNSRQPRLRYLFETIEHRKRANEGEVIAIKSDLSVEHIMPRVWRTHWQVPGFDHVGDNEIDAAKLSREITREQAVNKLGNLTLLTQKLNATISNSGFAVKMPAVRAHAALTLNRELHQFDHWDEATIEARGASLFEVARSIWPGPIPTNS